MKNILLLSFLLLITSLSAQKQPIALKWLDENTSKTDPSVSKQLTGVSWGVPFSRGETKPNTAFSLTNENGETLPLQTWTNAFWDDGSVKWLGLATVTDVSNKAFVLNETGTTKNAKRIGENIVKVTEGPLSICTTKGFLAFGVCPTEQQKGDNGLKIN